MANFEQQLKQRLAKATPPPPATEADWERLLSALPPAAGSKKRAGWWWTSAVLVTVAGAAVVLWLVLPAATTTSKPGAPVASDLKTPESKAAIVQRHFPTTATQPPAANTSGSATTLRPVEPVFTMAALHVATALNQQDNTVTEETKKTSSTFPEQNTKPPIEVDLAPLADKQAVATPPNDPKNTLPKLKSRRLTLRFSMEAEMLGSRQDGADGNAAYAALRKAGDRLKAGAATLLKADVTKGNLSMATGIGWQQQQFGGNYNYHYSWVDSFPVIVGGQIVGWGKNPPRDTMLNYSIATSIRSVVVPVSISIWQPVNGRWGLLAEAGARYTRITGSSGSLILPDKNLPASITTDLLKRNSFGINLGAGAYTQLNRSMRLYAKTGYTRQLTRLLLQHPSTSQSISLTLGCQFNL